MDTGDGAVSMYDWVVDRGIYLLDYARSFWSFFWFRGSWVRGVLASSARGRVCVGG